MPLCQSSKEGADDVCRDGRYAADQEHLEAGEEPAAAGDARLHRAEAEKRRPGEETREPGTGRSARPGMKSPST